MTEPLPRPTFPRGGTYDPPRMVRGRDHQPDAGTGYAELARATYTRSGKPWRWWRPLIALAITGAGMLLGQTVLLVAFLVIDLAGASRVETWDPEVVLDRIVALDATDVPVLIVTLGGLACLIPSIYLGLAVAGMRPIGHIGSVALRLRWRWMLSLLPVALASLVLSLGITILVSMVAVAGAGGAPDAEVFTPQWTPVGTLVPALLVIVLLVPFQAAAEEYLFRGLFVQTLAAWLPARRWSMALVVVVTTLLFVAGHVYDVWGLLDVGVFGLAAVWLTLRTGGLEAAISLHVVNNVVVFSLQATGIFGSTEGSGEGSLVGVLATLISTIAYCWVVAVMARRAGLRSTSPWPSPRGVAPVPLPMPGVWAPVQVPSQPVR
ncbi:CPBP family intramembrane glutamic endopeptidase [Serinibacter salmoneus]|nr:CPBP family intramembrane glutamic endopeptidase [Serinibacter salmoneus]